MEKKGPCDYKTRRSKEAAANVWRRANGRKKFNEIVTEFF